jgi:hypothetical protein
LSSCAKNNGQTLPEQAADVLPAMILSLALLWMLTVHSSDQLLIVRERTAQFAFSSLAALSGEFTHCRWSGSECLHVMDLVPRAGAAGILTLLPIAFRLPRRCTPEPLSVSAIPERIFVYNEFVSIEL